MSIGIGGIAICNGLVTLIMRVKDPSRLSKLEPMKRLWGDGPGNALHCVAFTIVPIAAGIWFVIRGMRGEAVF